MTTSLISTGVLYPDGYVEPSAYVSMQNAIFSYGYNNFSANITYSYTVNYLGIVDNAVSVAAVPSIGSTGVSFGGDRGMFAFGFTNYPTTSYVNTSRIVSAFGVIGADISNATVGGWWWRAGCSYGGDKGIIAYGMDSAAAYRNTSNLVSNIGVISTSSVAAGTNRAWCYGAGYGLDKGIIPFGQVAANTVTNISTLVSNVGLIGAETTYTANNASVRAGANYGGDKAVFAFGRKSFSGPTDTAGSNLLCYVTNLGVVGSDVTLAIGLTSSQGGAASYGGDKAVFAGGTSPYAANVVLVNNVGTISSYATIVMIANAQSYPSATTFGC